MNVVKQGQNSQDSDVRVITNRKTMVIIQLARSGDLVQTCMAVSALKIDHPEVDLVLVCRKNFYYPVKFICDSIFKKTVVLDFDLITKDDVSLSAVKIKVSSIINQINALAPTIVVNLTHSRSSSFLTSLINSKFKVGPYFDQQFKLVVEDVWSQYLYSNVLGSEFNPFSLVDVFGAIIGVNRKVSNSFDHLPDIQDNLFIDNKKCFVTIHPFASHQKKMWRPEKWSEVIYKILKENNEIKVIILGSELEQNDSERIIESTSLQRFNNRILNMVGKRSVHWAYTAIKNSILFIGHDSLLGHIAALAQTPSITISLGTVRPFETTPYHDNAYFIAPKTACFPCKPSKKCDLYECHTDISYQVLSSLSLQLISNGELNQKFILSENSDFHLSNISLYKCQTDQNNFLVYKKLISENYNARDILKIVYRILWLYTLSEKEESTQIPKINRSLVSEIQDVLQGLHKLFELAEFGKKFCRYILQEIGSPTPSIKSIKDYSNKIDELDKLMEMVQVRYGLLSPIIDFHKVQKSNVSGENTVVICENTYLCFESLESSISVVFELLEKIIIESDFQDSSKSKDKSNA